VDSPDIVVGAGLIPGMVNSSTDGVMVDLIKAMAAAYKDGSMAVRAMTVGRLDVELAEGLVDMSMPYIRMRPNDDVNFNFRFTRQSYGKVSFVLYSRKAAPVTKEAITRAVVRQPFPFKIESAEFDWGFPVTQFLSFESAFKKLSSGRIDAFLWAQEEADEELRRQGDKSIVRELFGVYDDVFAVQRNARGDFVEKVYEETLEVMRKSGKLKEIYSRIHLPFEPWQP
jgi:ABC-type amino acid transport substrate-binding protein